MDLTPVYEGEKGLGDTDDLVVLSSNSVTVLNVQTAEVKRQSLNFSLRVAGTLDADETRKVIFSAPAAGRIEEMAVQSVGDQVDAEQRLFTFYSPELATWRRAYVIRNRSTTLTTPYFAGRLHEGPVPGTQTKPNQSKNGGAKLTAASESSETDPYFSDLLSPLTGTVVERKVFNGQYVSEGDRLLTIVDTSVLWFRFDVYERQLPFLQQGDVVKLTVPAAPGQEFTGVISLIEPTLDEVTRTVKVRADISNPIIAQGTSKRRPLRLGMYADGVVMADLPGVLAVPRSAILFPGGKSYAYVEEGPGAYAMRQVKLGRQGDNVWEVIDGLKEGERVVTSGNVLIDAQAQFNSPKSPENSKPAPTVELANAAAPHAEHTNMSADHSPDMGSMMAMKHNDSTAMNESSSANPVPAASADIAPPATQQANEDTEPAQDRVVARNIASRRAAGMLSFGTTNTRHPEARERMARSFAAGLAEKHRVQEEAAAQDSTQDAPTSNDHSSMTQAMASERHQTAAPEPHLAQHANMPGSPEHAVAPDLIDLNQMQRLALTSLFVTADKLGQALAADDLNRVKQEVPRVEAVLTRFKTAFSATENWAERVGNLEAASHWPKTQDLAEARKQFVSFSSNIVAVAQSLRYSEPQFAELKLYHCPMAPEPGLWMQLKGPLQNPFFGAKMLKCGEEWHP